MSQFEQENSHLKGEPASMSSVADVSEMQGICAAIVQILSDRDLQKQQVPKLAKLIGVTENRALEFLRAKARRVDSWEKDIARIKLAELKREQRRQRELDHLAWLRKQVAGAGGSGGDVLQRLLRGSGDETGAVALPETDADFDQRSGWGR